MRAEFDKWWDSDRLTQTNPFSEDSPAFWAWEGWHARAALAQQPSPPPEAKTKAEQIAYCAGWWSAMEAKAKEQQQAMPVAWIDNTKHPKHLLYWQSCQEKRLYGPLRPLYTTPPDHSEAMRMALHALEGWKDEAPSQWTPGDENTITALRAALGEP